MRIKASVYNGEECLIDTAIITLDEQTIKYIEDKQTSFMASEVNNAGLFEHVYWCGGFIEFYEGDVVESGTTGWEEPMLVPENAVIEEEPVEVEGTMLHIQDDCFYFTTHRRKMNEVAETIEIPYSALQLAETGAAT